MFEAWPGAKDIEQRFLTLCVSGRLVGRPEGTKNLSQRRRKYKARESRKMIAH